MKILNDISVRYEFFKNLLCYPKGAFNDYVDKKRWVAGPKFPVVVQVQGEKCPT